MLRESSVFPLNARTVYGSDENTMYTMLSLPKVNTLTFFWNKVQLLSAVLYR